jgi:hypothetical protein
LANYRSCSGYEIIVGLPKTSKECGHRHFWAGANQGGEAGLRAEPPASGRNTALCIETAKAGWSEATKKEDDGLSIN